MKARLGFLIGLAVACQVNDKASHLDSVKDGNASTVGISVSELRLNDIIPGSGREAVVKKDASPEWARARKRCEAIQGLVKERGGEILGAKDIDDSVAALLYNMAVVDLDICAEAFLRKDHWAMAEEAAGAGAGDEVVKRGFGGLLVASGFFFIPEGERLRRKDAKGLGLFGFKKILGVFRRSTKDDKEIRQTVQDAENREIEEVIAEVRSYDPPKSTYTPATYNQRVDSSPSKPWVDPKKPSQSPQVGPPVFKPYDPNKPSQSLQVGPPVFKPDEKNAASPSPPPPASFNNQSPGSNSNSINRNSASLPPPPLQPPPLQPPPLQPPLQTPGSVNHIPPHSNVNAQSSNIVNSQKPQTTQPIPIHSVPATTPSTTFNLTVTDQSAAIKIESTKTKSSALPAIGLLGLGGLIVSTVGLGLASSEPSYLHLYLNLLREISRLLN